MTTVKSFVLLFSLVLTMWAEPVENVIEKDCIAVILKIDGEVKVLSKESIKKHKAKSGESLFSGDRLISYENSTAVVKLKDNSKVILDDSSEIVFTDFKNIKQDSGEVYYNIEKRTKAEGLLVSTPFSIMGIKGTEFIVNATGNGEIALNEGVIGIESLSADFELHKKAIMEEYEKFKDKQMKEFEAYKTQKEEYVVTYVKTFDLEPRKVLNFISSDECEESCEKRVDENEFTDDLDKRFEEYKAMLEE